MCNNRRSFIVYNTMTTVKPKLLLTSFGLAAYILSFVLRVDGVVLCLGQDGHIELEMASPSLTCAIPAASEALHTSISMPQDRLLNGHCGPCTDVPLMLTDPNTIIIPTQEAMDKAQLFTANHLNSYLLPSIGEAPTATLQQPSAGNFPLASLRTVILLI